MSDLATLITQIPAYLNNRDIGVRRFAALSGIQRTRLNRLFAGATATIAEVDAVDRAINQIEAVYRKIQARKTVKTP